MLWKLRKKGETMLDLYVNVKNSIIGLESALRIAISNANNFNTPGFKYTFASFTTVYSEAIRGGTETKNPLSVGSSMTLGSTTIDFSQGNLSLGTEMDNAIVGEGFFILSNSAVEFDDSSPKVYTRAGRFQTDANNEYLTDAFGRKVFGYPLDASGNIVGSELVPIQTDGHTDIGFTDNGVLVSNYQESIENDDVDATPMYQLALTTFQNKQGLVPARGGAYANTISAGDELPISTSGGEIGDSGSTYGDIVPDSLESANVDVAKVALDMNLLNRGFSAVQGVIDDITKILQNLIQKIGGG